MSSETTTSVSIVIPTLNAGGELDLLLSVLVAQERPAEEILVVDSSSEDDTAQVCNRYAGVRLITVAREEFDHGRTRDMALRQTRGDIIVFLTQDAVPTDRSFLEKLIAPLRDPLVAISVGRQLPKPDATRMETLVRGFNYPAESSVRSEADIPRLGIKAFFCSDSCAAYRKDVYLKLGGFEYPIKSNEDMLFAARALRGGFRVAYTAEAAVYHSHNFTLREQYRRNYIQGYEIERHRELLGGAALSTEGTKLVKNVSRALLRDGDVISFARFGFDCCARFLGNRAGRNAYRREQRKNATDG